MNLSESRVCHDCGAPLAEDNSASTCARCLLEACFDGASVYGAPEAAETLSSNLAVPGELFGDYELQEEIARGGMGVVFKARQRSLGRIVALKMMLPGWLSHRDIVRRFRIEAEAASRLMHPGIVAIHDVGECDGQHFYSMDYIEGVDLARRVEKGPVSPTLAAGWIRAVAEAIHHAHQRGILHRDLKPANVLIDASEQPHVTDFGLAKLLDEARELTVPGRVLGTPSFMPPEQADPRRGGVTVASDVYGLGAILYFLLAGKAPFQGNTLEHTLKLVLTEDPVPLSQQRAGIPRDLETICLKCLSKEPQRRYASAAELAEDLGAWSRREPIRARPVTRTERLWFWTRRNPWLAGVSAGLIVTAIAGAVLQERALREARRERAVAEGLVQFMNEDLTYQLRPLGRLRLLDNVNRTVQRYYTGLPMKQTPSDPRAGRAQFYQNNAAVLREMGRLDEAKESARSAIGLLEPLVQQEPQSAVWPVALAEAHAEMRNILSTVDSVAALAHAEEAVRYCSRAYKLNSASDDSLAKLAHARLELSSVLQQQGKAPEAEREIRAASELLAKLSPTGTNAVTGRLLSALSCYYQGLVHFDRRQNAEARSQFADYLHRMVKLVAENPGDARMLQSLAVAHSHLGRALLEHDEDGEALQHFREYHRVAQDLERLDPGNVNYRQELGFSLNWLYKALRKANGGTAEELTSLLTGSQACFQKLADDFPQGDLWQDHAVGALHELVVWQETKDKEKARWLLAEELNHRWTLLLQFHGNRRTHQRFVEALDWSERPLVAPEGGGSDKIARMRKRVSDITGEISRRGASPEWNWTHATLQNRLADALAEAQQFESAKRELEAALPLWKELAQDQPADLEAAPQVARVFCAINRVSLFCGNARPDPKALRSFADWLNTRRPAAASMNAVHQAATKLHSELAAGAAQRSADEQSALADLDRAIATLKSNLPVQAKGGP